MTKFATKAEIETAAIATFEFATRWEGVLLTEAAKLKCTCVPVVAAMDESRHMAIDCPVCKLLQVARLIAGEGEEAKAKVFGLQRQEQGESDGE